MLFCDPAYILHASTVVMEAEESESDRSSDGNSVLDLSYSSSSFEGSIGSEDSDTNVEIIAINGRFHRHTPTTTLPLRTQLAGNRAHSLFRFLRRGCNFATPSAAQDGSSATREGERDRVRERERGRDRNRERERERGRGGRYRYKNILFFLKCVKTNNAHFNIII